MRFAGFYGTLTKMRSRDNASLQYFHQIRLVDSYPEDSSKLFDLSPLPLDKVRMSVVDLDLLSNDNLRKRIASLPVLEDSSDKCGQCGHPSLLHKGGLCTRKEREPPDTVDKVWSNLRRQAKQILPTLKADF